MFLTRVLNRWWYLRLICKNEFFGVSVLVCFDVSRCQGFRFGACSLSAEGCLRVRNGIQVVRSLGTLMLSVKGYYNFCGS